MDAQKAADSAAAVVRECFWGDYDIRPGDVVARLQQGDEVFARFLFSRIVENSRHPSKHLRALFGQDTLRRFFVDYAKRCRDPRRLAVIRSNATGEPAEVPGLEWRG